MKFNDIINELYDLSDQLLNADQPVKVSVGGYSMFPILRSGDVITICKCPVNNLIIGDIVVCKIGNKWIAHRLLNITTLNNRSTLTTKGDTCRNADPQLSEENYMGKAVSYLRNGKEKSLERGLPKHSGRLIAHMSKVLMPFFVLFLWLVLGMKRLAGTAKRIYKDFLFVSLKSRKLTFINVIISMLQGILPFVIIYLVKLLIDDISNIHAYPDKVLAYKKILGIIIATGLVFLVSSVLTIINSVYRERLSQSVSLYVYDLLHQKYTALDMAYLEDADQLDKIHRAVQEAGFRPLKLITEGLTSIQSLVSWLAIVVMLINVHWDVFLLIIIAVLPGFLVRFRFSGKFFQLNKSMSRKEREAYYYSRILTGSPFAKEVRLFGLRDFFTSRFNMIQANLHHQKNSLLRRRAIADVLAQTFAVVMLFGSFAYVTFLAVKGTLSIGTVVLFFLVFQRGFSVLKDLIQSIAGLYEDSVFLSDFLDFLLLPGLHKFSGSQLLNPLQIGIKINNLSFQYPSSNRQALKAVSMDIPAGKTIAIVGANGSGKTTLVKLLCGFYTPTSGQIYFDHTDISLISEEEIRKQITAVFQDFALYNISAADNIALGDISRPKNIDNIRQAAQNADIGDILEKLPRGYETLLGNLFEKGEELSIGQWQKIAIARAFYRNSSILLMDEPSSALDAETEINLLQNLKLLAKDKTVLIISHRLSTVQWADMIYVMDDGEVIEYGTHKQLMEVKGKYYKMYELNRL